MRKAGDGTTTSTQAGTRGTTSARDGVRASPRGGKDPSPKRAAGKGQARPTVAASTAASKAKAKAKPKARTGATSSPASARIAQPVSGRFSKVNKGPTPTAPGRSPRGEARESSVREDSPELTNVSTTAKTGDDVDGMQERVSLSRISRVSGVPALELASVAPPLECESTLQPIAPGSPGDDSSEDENVSGTVLWPNAPQVAGHWQDGKKDISNRPSEAFGATLSLEANDGGLLHSGPTDMMNELSRRLQAESDAAALLEARRQSREECEPTSTPPQNTDEHRSTPPRSSPPRSTPPRNTAEPVLSPRASVTHSVATNQSQDEVDTEELKALTDRLEKGMETLAKRASALNATDVEQGKAERRDTHVAITQMQQEIAELKARVAAGQAKAVTPRSSLHAAATSTSGSFSAGGADGGAGGEVLRERSMPVQYRPSSDPVAMPYNSAPPAVPYTNTQPQPQDSTYHRLSQLSGTATIPAMSSPVTDVPMAPTKLVTDVEAKEPPTGKSSPVPPLSAGEDVQDTPYQRVPATEEHLQHLLRDVYDKICVCSDRVREQKGASEVCSDRARQPKETTEGGATDVQLNAESLFGAVTDEEVASRKETWKEIDSLRQALVSMHQHLQSAQQRTRVLEQQCQEYERHVQQLMQPNGIAAIAKQEPSIGRPVSRPITPMEHRPVTPGNVSITATPGTISRVATPAKVSRSASPHARGARTPTVATAVAPAAFSWARGAAAATTTAATIAVPASAEVRSVMVPVQPLSARGHRSMETRAASAPRMAPPGAASHPVVMRINPGTTSPAAAAAVAGVAVTHSREATPVPRKVAPTTPRAGPEGGTALVFEPYMNVSPACLPWVSASADGFVTPSPQALLSPTLASGPAAEVPGRQPTPTPGAVHRQASSPSTAVQRFVSMGTSTPGLAAGAPQSPSPRPAQPLAGLGGYQSAGAPVASFVKYVPSSASSTPAVTPRQMCMKRC